MQTLRIFVSSPGDVANERQICGKVIERIQGRYWSLIRIEGVFWENEALRATATFQDEIDDPAECEIVIGIIWTKMGSPLPERFTRLDGRSHAPGTEWEIGRAITAYEEKVANGSDPKTTTPNVVVYRRRDKRAPLVDREEEEKAADREREVHEFFDKEFHNDDQAHTFKRASISYLGIKDFEEKLLRQLARLVLKQIPVLKTAFNLPPIGGSPFKGLQSFDFIDNDRFFGRTREIREAQRRLVSSARKNTPFLLIYGGSGFGKSSLMRAGLAPVITRPGGSLDEIQGWRRVPFQPAKSSGVLCERLARVLLLPPSPEEAQLSREHTYWPLTGLPELLNNTSHGSPWDSASLARHFVDDDKRIFAIAAITETLENLHRHLLLEIDQLEEIFTTKDISDSQEESGSPRGNSPNRKQISAFFATLGALAMTGRVWIVATMRSEFFPRVAENPGLFALVGKDRGYILPPPDRQSLREIIRYPALAARLDFQRRIEDIEIAGEKARHDYLHDQILADAEDSPDALPLLEFTLQQLYDARKDGLLVWNTYASFGGLKGAIARRATEVYQTLDPVSREARHSIFAALVHIDQSRGTVSRQRAALAVLKNHTGAEAFLEAFLNAHLLVTDGDSLGKEPIVTLAHEALISHWNELSVWIQNHRGVLLARQRLAEQARLWSDNGERKTYLLSEARLAEALRVKESRFFLLTGSERRYLTISERRATRKQRLLWGAVALFATLAVASGVLAKVAERETTRANGRLADNYLSLARSEIEQGRFQNAGLHATLAERLKGPKINQSQQGKPPRNEINSIKAVAATALPAWAHHCNSSEGPESFSWFLLSPDESLLLASHVRNGHEYVDILDARTGTLLNHQKIDGLAGNAIFNLRGDTMIAGQYGELLKYRFDRENLTLEPDGKARFPADASATTLLISGDGNLVFVGHNDGSVSIWNLASLKMIHHLDILKESVTRMSLAKSDSLLRVLGNQSLTVLNLETMKAFDPASRASYSDIHFPAKGDRMILTSDQSISFSAASEGQTKPLGYSSMRGGSAITAVALSRRQPLCVTGSKNGVVCFYDSETGTEMGYPLDLHSGETSSMIHSDVNRSLYTLSGTGLVQAWKQLPCVNNPALVERIPEGGEAVARLDETSLAIATFSGELIVIDSESGSILENTGMFQAGRIREIAMSQDGRTLACIDHTGLIRLIDRATLLPIHRSIKLPGKEYPSPVQLGFINNQELVATTFDGVYKLVSGPEFANLEVETIWEPDLKQNLVAAHLDPTSSRLFLVQLVHQGPSSPRNLISLDLRTGTRRTAALPEGLDPSFRISVSSDGSFLAFGTQQGMVHVFTSGDLKAYNTFVGTAKAGSDSSLSIPNDPISSLAFGADPTEIWTGTKGGSLSRIDFGKDWSTRLMIGRHAFPEIEASDGIPTVQDRFGGPVISIEPDYGRNRIITLSQNRLYSWPIPTTSGVGRFDHLACNLITNRGSESDEWFSTGSFDWSREIEAMNPAKPVTPDPVEEFLRQCRGTNLHAVVNSYLGLPSENQARHLDMALQCFVRAMKLETTAYSTFNRPLFEAEFERLVSASLVFNIRPAELPHLTSACVSLIRCGKGDQIRAMEANLAHLDVSEKSTWINLSRHHLKVSVAFSVASMRQGCLDSLGKALEILKNPSLADDRDGLFLRFLATARLGSMLTGQECVKTTTEAIHDLDLICERWPGYLGMPGHLRSTLLARIDQTNGEKPEN